jgi:hypothetical protein
MIRFFLLVLCIYVTIPSNTYAQFANSYSIIIDRTETKKNEYDHLITSNSLYVSLYEDHTYTIGIIDFHWSASLFDSSVGNMSIMAFHLSIGEYETTDNFIILTDSYTHHQFLYQFDSLYLRPLKTYPFLMEKVFIDDGERTNLEEKDSRETIPVKKAITDIKKTNSQKKIKEGTYFYSRFQLVLHENNQFELFFKKESLDNLNNQSELNLLFFTGKWKCKGKILILGDTNFEHKFYGLIREEGIELFVFPMEDIVFTKELHCK